MSFRAMKGILARRAIKFFFVTALSLNIMAVENSVFAREKASKTLATFSNTQRWGDQEIYFLESWKGIYVPAAAADPVVKSLPPPPLPDSTAGQLELRYLKSLESFRTAADLERIEREKEVCGFRMGPYRIGLNPELDNLVLAAIFDSRAWGFKAKMYFDRVRPSFVSPDLKPHLENPVHPAYPSNHTIHGLVAAAILGKVVPDRAAEITHGALQIGRDRELAGVHYPSDTEASVILAKEFNARLFQNDLFMAELSKIEPSTLKWLQLDDTKGEISCHKLLNAWTAEHHVFKTTQK